MWSFNLIFICAAFTILSSQATPVDKKALPKDLLVPFNDLLPPLLDTETSNATSSTISTTKATKATKATKTTKAPTVATTTAKKATQTTRKHIATHAPPSLFKSTKKSYYQQQTEHIKELHLIDDEKLVPHDYREQAEHLQHLHATGENEYQQQLQQQQQQQLQQKLQQKQKLEQAIALRSLKQQQQVQRKTAASNAKISAPNQQHVQITQTQQTSFSQKKAAKPLAKNVSQQTKAAFKTQTTTEQQAVLTNVAATPAQPKQQVAAIHAAATPVRFKQQAELGNAAAREVERAQLKQQVETTNDAAARAHLHRFDQAKIQQNDALRLEANSAPLFQQLSQHRFNLQPQSYHAEPQSLSFEALHQYIDYRHTTQRPPKAGLPTLTPFPRHLK